MHLKKIPEINFKKYYKSNSNNHHNKHHISIINYKNLKSLEKTLYFYIEKYYSLK
jgi:hypothetical protein